MKGVSQKGETVQQGQSRLRLLDDIIYQLNLGRSLDEVFGLVYERLHEFLPYNRIAIALTDERGEHLTIVAARSDSPMILSRGYSGVVAGSSLEPLIRDGKTRIINDLEEYLAKRPSSESTRQIVKEGMRSSLTLPLVVQGRPIGVMFFSSHERNAYRPAHEEFLRGVVGQLAIAVERSRLIEALIRSQSLAAVGELAATIAHEIKNPLAGMSGAIQVLEDAIPVTDPRRGVVSEILDQINRLDNTVRDLLLFSRPATPTRSDVALSDVLIRSWALQTRTQEVQFSIKGADGVHVHADGTLLQQVFVNLFQNAIDAMPEGGVLNVNVRNGPVVCVEVKDTGCGIDEAHLPKMFRPFFSTKTRGTGLGLAISRKNIEAHGGSMSIESKKGVGTTVSLELPR